MKQFISIFLIIMLFSCNKSGKYISPIQEGKVWYMQDPKVVKNQKGEYAVFLYTQHYSDIADKNVFLGIRGDYTTLWRIQYGDEWEDAFPRNGADSLYPVEGNDGTIRIFKDSFSASVAASDYIEKRNKSVKYRDSLRTISKFKIK